MKMSAGQKTVALVKNDMSEILEDSYKVSLKEVCEALQIKSLQDLLEEVSSKNFFFSKVALSNTIVSTLNKHTHK